MTATEKQSFVKNMWKEKDCKFFSEEQLLLYRSNLLGSDLRITNFGGGNTSAKIQMKDPLTAEEVEVLWVKGSGGDLGSMKLDGFAALYLKKLHLLKKLYKGNRFEDKMVSYYPHCTFNLNPRAASIDTPLHAFIPYKHVDHMHPDSAIAIAASKDGEKITIELFEGELGWLSWQRPGFDLGLKLEKVSKENPALKGIMLESHGLFTWGETARDCYDTTIRMLQKAEKYIAEKSRGKKYFGGFKFKTAGKKERNLLFAELLPVLRGKLSRDNLKIVHYNDSPEILDFVNSYQAEELAELGTSCPDHFLRTKIKPLFIDFDPAKNKPEDIVKKLDFLLEKYFIDYKAYYVRNKLKDSPPMRDAYPVVILIPGIGMLTYAKDKKTARIAGEFYVNAVNVMRGASLISEYVSLPEDEAFNIEYWALEEAKLKRMPKPRQLAGRIALITGGAGGIGKASAKRILQENGCVVLTDIDEKELKKAEQELINLFGQDSIRSAVMDITDEKSVIESVNFCLKEFGGIDILVCSAGVASASPYEETTLEIWNKNIGILTTGYFLVSREVFRVMKSQGIGGSIVFVASKNALAASPNAAAYCTAKSAELHLARCIAVEGAPYGIRVNSVNPDAVLQGSKIWTGKWRKERAEAYNIDEEKLEEFYRNRSMLKQNVYPEDLAEAIYFFVSDLSAKSTGNILNVDSGNSAAFTR